MANANTNLHKARIAKNDEFYTQLTDIAKEMVHYSDLNAGPVLEIDGVLKNIFPRILIRRKKLKNP